MQIIVPSIPKRYVITQGMTEDLLYDPAKGAWVFFRIKLDAFQSAALKIQWLSYDSYDHSGHGSSKTHRAWILSNLSGILIPGAPVMGIVYQDHEAGKQNFWSIYDNEKFMTPLFRAQLGRFDKGSHKERSSKKGSGTWILYFKSGARIEMPAPGHYNNSDKLGSWQVNRMVLDEQSKIQKMGSGIEDQLINRVRKTTNCFNDEHPVWQNKIWRMGTAEMADHPAYPAYQRRVKDEKRGAPTIYSFGFCYKDWSNLICSFSKKSWRDTVPAWKSIRASKRDQTKAKHMAEGLGIFAEASEGWYNAQWLNAAEEVGRKIGLEPILSRAQDLGSTDETRYFGGIDAARSSNPGNDEGAGVVLRAHPRVEMPSDNDADWDLRYIFAKVYLNHDGGKWSGAIHDLHRCFGFTGILMDPGGSDFISSELKKERQEIDGIEVRCSPIVTKDDTEVASGAANFIMNLTRSADPGLRNLWPDLAHARSGGGDTLKYFMNSSFQTAWEKGFLILPAPYHEFKAAKLTDGWSGEKIKASRLINPKMKGQILAVNSLMDEKGHYALTSNNAVQFIALGKDDFHDAARNAYIAFKIWLTENEGQYTKASDSGMFYSATGGTGSGSVAG